MSRAALKALERLSQFMNIVLSRHTHEVNPNDSNELSLERDKMLELSDVDRNWWTARNTYDCQRSGLLSIQKGKVVFVDGSTY